MFIRAGAVILATGGAGRLYLQTNNVPGAVGLGLAMALSSGLSLTDMEFVQFYPTCLNMPGKPRVIALYETMVAIAGAALRNRLGEDRWTTLMSGRNIWATSWSKRTRKKWKYNLYPAGNLGDGL